MPTTATRDPIRHFHRQFEKAMAQPAAAAAPWLRDLRERAFDRFSQVGFPTTHEEDWRFTNVQPIADTPFELAAPGRNGISAAGLSRMLGGQVDFPRLVFVDGRFSATLSSRQYLSAGIRLESLAAAVTSAPDLLREHLGRYARMEDNPFSALGTAFGDDGALLHLPPGVTSDTPIQLVFIAGGTKGTMNHPRCLVVVDRGAQAVVQEIYLTLEDGASFTNAVTELVVAEGGRLDHCRFQRESESAFHVATTRSHQGQNSVLESCTVTFGASLARHHLGAVLDGSGAFLILNGLSVLTGRQHVDYHTVIDHAQPHCESHEVFNGIFDDHARGVFSGRIVVRPGAQRTDSKQTNNNLLLSANARADSQPQLEIYADDVKCTHGATLGPLDDASMFYLRSRGLGPSEARQMLTYGFGADIVERIRNAPIRRQLDAALADRLGRMLG